MYRAPRLLASLWPNLMLDLPCFRRVFLLRPRFLVQLHLSSSAALPPFHENSMPEVFRFSRVIGIPLQPSLQLSSWICRMMPARLCFGACGPMQGLILCTWVRPAAQPHVLACSRAPYLCQAACLRYAPASASEVSQSSLWHSFPAAVSGVWATSARGKSTLSLYLSSRACLPAGTEVVHP